MTDTLLEKTLQRPYAHFGTWKKPCNMCYLKFPIRKILGLKETKHRITMIVNYRKLIFVLNQVEQKSLLDRNHFKIHSLYIDLRNSY